MSPPDAFIFAGGRSTRMGTDKALLELQGRGFVERILAAIRSVSRSVTIVGREHSIEGVEAVPDLRAGLGPLAGIETALARCETDRALIIACDLPFVSTELIELLLNRSADRPETAVVPLDSDGRVSPMCAIYPRSAFPLVTELLDGGDRKPRALLMKIPTDLVPFADYAHLDGATDLLRNVNTASDLTEASRIAGDSSVR